MHRGYGMAIHCGEGTNIQGFSKKMEAERDGRWSTDDKKIRNSISFYDFTGWLKDDEEGDPR